MRPDRLVVGEVRGGEVVDLLAALNTGHEGGCGTLHANSALDVPARIEALALAAGLGRAAAHSQLASAVDVVLHLARGPDGRRRLAQVAVPERERDGSGDDGVRGRGRRRRRRYVPGRRRRSWPAARSNGTPDDRPGRGLRRRGGAGGVPAPPRLPVRSIGGPPRWLVAPVLGAVAAVALVGGSARWLFLAVLATATAWAVARLLRQRARRREARDDAARVLEACELLAAELGAGRPPGPALERAAGDWPHLAGVAEAFRVGADVPAALRTAATLPGRGRPADRGGGLAGRAPDRPGARRRRRPGGPRPPRRPGDPADRRRRAGVGAGHRPAGRRPAGPGAADGLRRRRRPVGLPAPAPGRVWPAWPPGWRSGSPACGGSRRSPATSTALDDRRARRVAARTRRGHGGRPARAAHPPTPRPGRRRRTRRLGRGG